MYKIGLSATGKELVPSLFENFKNAGISCMEISTTRENNEKSDYAELKKMSDEYGIKLWSYHLPFKPFDFIDISASDADWRKRSIAYIAEIIKKAADIGIDKYILHSGGKVGIHWEGNSVKRNDESEAAERLKYACESYAEFAEIAHRAGGVICVENLPPQCVGRNMEEVRKLVSADDRLRVCFDTNHLLPGDGAEFIRAFADRLITIHVSDYDFINERHWLPGEGKLDWQSIYSALNEIGYKGPWMYEISFKNQPTITRERELVCEDFVRNANEIFENKPFTLIPSKITV